MKREQIAEWYAARANGTMFQGARPNGWKAAPTCNLAERFGESPQQERERRERQREREIAAVERAKRSETAKVDRAAEAEVRKAAKAESAISYLISWAIERAKRRPHWVADFEPIINGHFDPRLREKVEPQLEPSAHWDDERKLQFEACRRLLIHRDGSPAIREAFERWDRADRLTDKAVNGSWN